jgi:hypothetical protein
MECARERLYRSGTTRKRLLKSPLRRSISKHGNVYSTSTKVYVTLPYVMIVTFRNKLV